jgi:hypothetical protein
MRLMIFWVATPTALRGRVFDCQTDSHAHAEPWAWHAISSLWQSLWPFWGKSTVNGVERRRLLVWRHSGFFDADRLADFDDSVKRTCVYLAGEPDVSHGGQAGQS